MRIRGNDAVSAPYTLSAAPTPPYSFLKRKFEAKRKALAFSAFLFAFSSFSVNLRLR